MTYQLPDDLDTIQHLVANRYKEARDDKSLYVVRGDSHRTPLQIFAAPTTQIMFEEQALRWIAYMLETEGELPSRNMTVQMTRVHVQDLLAALTAFDVSDAPRRENATDYSEREWLTTVPIVTNTSVTTFADVELHDPLAWYDAETMRYLLLWALDCAGKALRLDADRQAEARDAGPSLTDADARLLDQLGCAQARIQHLIAKEAESQAEITRLRKEIADRNKRALDLDKEQAALKQELARIEYNYSAALDAVKAERDDLREQLAATSTKLVVDQTAINAAVRLIPNATREPTVGTVDPFTTQVGGSHYKDLKIQPMQYALENNLNMAQASVVKYVTRYAAKNGVQDLRKAIHNIQLLAQHEYGEVI